MSSCAHSRVLGPSPIFFSLLAFLLVLTSFPLVQCQPVDLSLIWKRKGFDAGGTRTVGARYPYPAYAETPSGRKLVISASMIILYAIDLETHEVVWYHDNMDRITGGITVVSGFQSADDMVFLVGTKNHELGGDYVHCFDEFGNILWKTKVQDLTGGASGGVNGVLAVKLGDGSDPGPWRVIAAIEQKEGSLYEKTVYVLDTRGNIIDNFPRSRTDPPPAEYDGSDGWCSKGGMSNLAFGDFTGNGFPELVYSTDICWICGWDHNFDPLGVNTEVFPYLSLDIWGKVTTSDSYENEKCTHGMCYGEEVWLGNFRENPPTLFTVPESDKTILAVLSKDFDGDSHTIYLSSLLLFESGRERYRDDALGRNWETDIPEYTTHFDGSTWDINPNIPEVVTVDVTGNGEKNLVFPLRDGYVHALNLDKTEAWSVKVTNSESVLGPDRRFTSGIVVFRREGEDHAYVVFGDYGEHDAYYYGSVYIVHGLTGAIVVQYELPDPHWMDWGGAYHGIMLFHATGHDNLFLSINTRHGGNVLYGINGTAGADILWQTNRRSFFRNAYVDEDVMGPDFYQQYGYSPDPNVGLYVGVSLGVIFGLVLLVGLIAVLVVAFVCIRRNRQQEKGTRSGSANVRELASHDSETVQKPKPEAPPTRPGGNWNGNSSAPRTPPRQRGQGGRNGWRPPAPAARGW